jgi:hypothetical protein
LAVAVLCRRGRKQQVEEPLVDLLVREILDLAFALLTNHLDRAVDEVAIIPSTSRPT